MLRSIKSLTGFSAGARDGEIGRVNSFLFDDRRWAIRYLVVDTGGWLSGRRVLIAAGALDRPDWHTRLFRTNLTMQQVRGSPDIDATKPVQRGHETELHEYYNWVPYWQTGYGAAVLAIPSAPQQPKIREDTTGASPTIRSTREVAGYRIHATDGPIGHVEDFIISDEDWVIRYIVVDTGSWLSGRSVLVSPEWVERISWERREVWVDVSRKTVEDCPPYDPSAPVNREYEVQMYDYYGRPKYWS